MYKRNGSFFNSMLVFAVSMLVFALITLPAPNVWAQAANTTLPANNSDVTAADLEVGPDPVFTPALDTGSTDSSPQVLSGSSDVGTDTASFPAADEEPAKKPHQPRLNRVAGEAFLVLDQKAAARPLLFLNVLVGMVGALLLLARLRTRQLHRSCRYIALVRHRSHV